MIYRDKLIQRLEEGYEDEEKCRERKDAKERKTGM